jgi:hypothetical protein
MGFDDRGIGGGVVKRHHHRARTPWHGAIIIGSVWVLGIIVLVVGTLTHSSIGLVWPMGEDITWSLWLKQGVGALAAQQEFAADHRNPLSGWIYSLAAPLILGHQYGLHFLRLLTCLMLGLSFYALARQFCRGRATYFPVLLGSIISIWWFWDNYSQVVWIMLFVLSLSALIVWSYCVYVDSDRTKGAFYGWSIALWLIALGTYSIQCGAVIPVILIALFRGQWRGWREAILAAIRDAAPYLLVGAAFGAIWVTAAGGFFADGSIVQTTHANISATALLQSMRYFIWHPSFSRLFAAVFAFWSAGAIVLIFVCVTSVMYVVKRLTFDEPDSWAESLRTGAGWMLVTVIGLALPTLFLESTSATWQPGYRSHMMFAAFVPTFLLCVIALLWPVRHAATALFVSGSILASAVVMLSLEQNRQGVAATRWQRNLASGLAPFQKNEAVHFVVINTSGVSYSAHDAETGPFVGVGHYYGALFVQDKLNHFPTRWSLFSLPTESSMRIVETQPAPPGYVGSWRIVFHPNVVVGAMYGNSDPVPRETVRIVKFDGEKVTPLIPLRSDFTGLQADIVDVAN